jgi:hypothetical protein
MGKAISMNPHRAERIGIAFALFLLVLVFLVFPTTTLSAKQRRRVAAAPRASLPGAGLDVTFLNGGDSTMAVLDAGAIAWDGSRRQVTVVSRTFTIRVGEASAPSGASVNVRAFLETADPRATIRIDGITLGAAPILIRHHAPIGVPLTHRLEIEIPITAPEGPLVATIGWETSPE